MEIALAGLRQLYATPRLDEQARPQQRFERVDLLADCRGRDAKLVRSFPDAPQSCRRVEDTD
jgi:hypothetical protein